MITGVRPARWPTADVGQAAAEAGFDLTVLLDNPFDHIEEVLREAALISRTSNSVIRAEFARRGG